MSQTLQEFFSGISNSVVFTRRPDPIPGDLRISWRLASLVLTLRRCRANTANIEQVHVLAWGLRSAQGRKAISNWFVNGRKPQSLVIRHDPSTSRTINLAIAAGLAKRNPNTSISLTADGERWANRLWSRKDVLIPEKQFLSTLPARITQKSVSDLLDWS
ncbi:hypothetical protein ACFVJH_18915 [Streptomyces decoyicus]|uniref:hypothetical protein n=1 Tax=Streptomyces decoyicus TaxID=249567 RepID=UPI003640691D